MLLVGMLSSETSEKNRQCGILGCTFFNDASKISLDGDMRNLLFFRQKKLWELFSYLANYPHTCETLVRVSCNCKRNIDEKNS